VSGLDGHGHVTPRPDGAKARCGGPALCSTCAREAALQRARARREIDLRDKYRLD
jgi:predicted NBD/HSP70 family sugar kinase